MQELQLNEIDEVSGGLPLSVEAAILIIGASYAAGSACGKAFYYLTH